LKWLARIPGARQIFDAMLLAATGLVCPGRLRAISAIESAVRRWPEMRVGVHRFGGIGFFFQGKESSHIHGNGLLDCYVGRANRDELIGSGRALPHHVFPHSGWISFWVRGNDDVQSALELIRVATERR
jgi:Family of unknown function (DUF5519)